MFCDILTAVIIACLLADVSECSKSERFQVYVNLSMFSSLLNTYVQYEMCEYNGLPFDTPKSKNRCNARNTLTDSFS